MQWFTNTISIQDRTNNYKWYYSPFSFMKSSYNLIQMNSSMCLLAPNPEMWIIQGMLAWHTPHVQIRVWNQTSPQEDRWGNLNEIQCRSNFLFICGIWAVWVDHHSSSCLKNPYIYFQCMNGLPFKHKFKFGLNGKIKWNT